MESQTHLFQFNYSLTVPLPPNWIDPPNVRICLFYCPPPPLAGWTPLMYACYVGHDTVVNLLLDSGAEPSRGTPSGLTPLMVAAGCGNESVCYFLLQVSGWCVWVCGCLCVSVCGWCG